MKLINTKIPAAVIKIASINSLGVLAMQRFTVTQVIATTIAKPLEIVSLLIGLRFAAYPIVANYF